MYVNFNACKTSINNIVEYVNYAEIIILNKKDEEVAKAIIDLEDVYKCSKLKWNINSGGY